MTRQRIGRRVVVEPLEARMLLSAVPLGDLALSDRRFGAGTTTTANVGGTVYFTISADFQNTQLWKTDGTPAGTSLVKTLSASVIPNVTTVPPVQHLTAVGGTLFFTVARSDGFDLWKSDGTAAGTVQLGTFTTQGGSAPYPGYEPDLTAVGSTLYFVTPTNTLGTSDGTAMGTSAYSYSNVKSLTSDGQQTLYFSATGGLFKKVGAGSPVNVSAAAPRDDRSMAFLNGDVYFISSTQLNRLNSAGGVEAIKAVSVPFDGLSELTVAGGLLYFEANVSPSDSGYGVWKSDGTTDGTVLVSEIPRSPVDHNLRDFTEAGGRLFFTADDFVTGRELWVTDGTQAGTVLVKDIEPGLRVSSAPAELTAMGGVLYFRARTSAGGYELWRSDGTDAGTHVVADLYPSAAASSMPTELRAVGNSLYFLATSGITGFGLFKTDGTADGAVLVKDHAAGALDAPMSHTAAPGGRFFYAAGQDTVGGRELYVSDGTAGGTTPFTDIYPAAWMSGEVDQLGFAGGRLYFAGHDSKTPTNPWSSDGTAAGTGLLKQITSGSTSSSPVLFKEFNGRAYFYAATSTSANRVLWTTDGTTAGTVPVTDSSGTNVSGSLVSFKGGVYVFGVNFFARISPTNPSLVVSVGTVSPTLPTRIEGARAVNGAIYFLGGDTMHGYELWKSDGTAAGTALLKDIFPGASYNSSNPSGFTAAGNWVVFSAFDGVHGYELWRTDGTAAGTALVKDINPGTGIGYLSSITNPAPISFDGLTYFMANDGVHGVELWRTDGTPGGTVMVADIKAGAGTSSPADLTISGGKLYFTADDGGAGGRELWVVDDQSAAGVRRVADVYPGEGSSNPMNLTDVEGTLFFTANDGVHGPRLFKLDEVAPTLTAVPRYDFKGTSQAVVLEFSEDVSASLTPAKLKLENRSSGQVVDPGLVRVEYDAAVNRAKVTVVGGMADGYYRLTSDATTDAGGNALAGGLSFDFAVMAGDADGNHTVDFNDLVVLAQHYNTVGGMTFAQGDFNYDGNVDFNDLVILAQRYNTTLAVPGGVVVVDGALAGVALAITAPTTGADDLLGKKTAKTPRAKVFHAPAVVRPPAVKKVAASPFAKVRVR